jgi:tetratricopeptide (TPR) repeat protein
MWNIVGIASLAVGILLIYSVLVKKFPQLKLIDLSTLAKERHAQVKTRIIKNRFDRSMGDLHSRSAAFFGSFGEGLRDSYRSVFRRLKALERGYEPTRRMTTEEISAAIPKLISEAEECARQGVYSEAEAKYIEALRFDDTNTDIYRGLADVYIDQKQYDQARETLEYVASLDAEDARAFEKLGTVEALSGRYREAEEQYIKSITLSSSPALIRAELGQVYLAMEDSMKAHEQFRLALESEPYHPKYLDYFLETSILIGDLDAAEGAFEVLETANPENQKLAEFRERIDQIRNRVTS